MKPEILRTPQVLELIPISQSDTMAQSPVRSVPYPPAAGRARLPSSGMAPHRHRGMGSQPDGGVKQPTPVKPSVHPGIPTPLPDRDPRRGTTDHGRLVGVLCGADQTETLGLALYVGAVLP